MDEHSKDIDALRMIRRVREYETDHEPDGWPAVKMSFLSQMADALEHLTNVDTLRCRDNIKPRL